MGITSTKLAALCGVSRATVDRVLNNRGRVSPATRQLVLQAAKKFDYRPNFLGMSLSRGKTFCIGIAVPSLKNQFFSLILDSTAKAARARNYAALVSLYEDDPEHEYTSIQSLLDRQVDGLIIFPTGAPEKTSALLDTGSIPAVTILNRIDGYACISPDYMAGMYEAAEYVINMDYTKLIFLCPPLNSSAGLNIDALLQRKEGFLKAVEAAYPKIITSHVISGYEYIDDIIRLQRAHTGKTAVLCSSDIYALDLMCELPQKGLDIPQDIGVMGFDGLEMLKYIEPSLTTVSVPVAMIGKNAADYLIDIINNGHSSVPLHIPHQIFAGKTT